MTSTPMTARIRSALLGIGVLAACCGGCDRGGTQRESEAASEATSEAAQAKAGEGPVRPPFGTETETETAIVERTGTTAGGGYLVRWRSGPDGIPALEAFSLEVEIEQAPGVPLAEDAVVLVDAAMPHHGHGMNFVPEIVRVAPGRYAVEGMLFHMRGRWELFVDVERDGLLERAQWTVELP